MKTTSLESFDASRAITAWDRNLFEVMKGESTGIFDPTTKKMLVPCQFGSVSPTEIKGRWYTFDEGNGNGIYDSQRGKVVLPTVCWSIRPITNSLYFVISPTAIYKGWAKVGLYVIGSDGNKLYVDRSDEEDKLPNLPGVKKINTRIPIFSNPERVGVTLHNDDIIILHGIGTWETTVFSKKKGKVIFQTGSND